MMDTCDVVNTLNKTDYGDHLIGGRGYDESSQSDQSTASTDASPFNSEHSTVSRRQLKTSRLMESLKRKPNLLRKLSMPNREWRERKSDREDDRRRIARSKSFSPLDSSSHYGEFNVTDVAHLPRTLLACLEDRDPIQARKAKFWLRLVEQQELAAEGECPTIDTLLINDDFNSNGSANRDPAQARKARMWLKLVEQQELAAEGKCSTSETPSEPREKCCPQECPSITIEESDNDECTSHLMAATL